jgi:RND superfamily putative drug exporter
VALSATGGVITSAGLVLASTFAVLGTLPLVFIAELPGLRDGSPSAG